MPVECLKEAPLYFMVQYRTDGHLSRQSYMNKVALLANTSQEFSDDAFGGRSDWTHDYVIRVPVQNPRNTEWRWKMWNMMLYCEALEGYLLVNMRGLSNPWFGPKIFGLSFSDIVSIFTRGVNDTKGKVYIRLLVPFTQITSPTLNKRQVS